MDGKQKSVAAITQELQNCSEEALIALCKKKCAASCRKGYETLGKGKKGA